MQRFCLPTVFPALAADMTQQLEKGNYMRKLLIASLAVTTLGFAACSDNSQQATQEAGEAIAQDAQTAGDAIAEDTKDTRDAIARDAAAAGDKTESGANNAADAPAKAARDAGNVIEGTVNAAGAAVNNAGDKIKVETEKAKANDQ